MLKRVTGALFEGDAGSDVQLVVQSQNNNGTESAKFEYDSARLTTQSIQGHPGCTFTIVPSIRQFEVIVAFDPGAPPGARYDLFQVNSAGGLSALGESVTSASGSPLIGFGIDGVAVAAAAPRRAIKGARRAAAPRAAAKRKAAKPRKARKAARKRTAAKKTRAAAKTRKTAGKRAGSSKRPARRAARSRKR